MNDRGYNLKLLIIGGFKTAAVYEELKAIKDANIVLLGKRDNVQDYLFCVDFFSLSSKWEGMPISLIEAFATGCIPVCTPAGGIKSMIEDGVNGFIAEGFERDDFIVTLCRSFSLSETHRQELSCNCLSTFNSLYSIGTCASNYIELYQSKL